MSVLYYSNKCQHCQKLLQHVSKINVKDIHFVCIDVRKKNKNGQTMVVLQNGQEILMPENIQKVPALLLLTQNYRVVYADDIYQFLKPGIQNEVKKATKNNMEPITYQDGFDSFSGFGNLIVSDNYSFLDQNGDEMGVKGQGGLRQMHNYVSLQDSNNLTMHLPVDDHEYKSNKLKDGDVSLESLMQKRQAELL